MNLEALMEEQSAPLTRRLSRMLGDPHAAEDVRQEAFARAWSSAPRDATADHQRAWLHRTATNLALDELRRRRVRRAAPLADELDAASVGGDVDEALAAREALARLTPHERMLLLMRFQAGLTHHEIAQLLDIADAAARQRVSRARRAFAKAMREGGQRAAPRVALLVADDAPDSCEAWLRAAGADVVVLPADQRELTLAGADAFVLSGSHQDLHPGLYGEELGPHTHGADLERDRRDLKLVRQALIDDLPIVGVCRGSQLLNIVLGGSLHQDLGVAGMAGDVHGSDESHRVRTGDGSKLRGIVGTGAKVGGAHHQGIKRIGRGIRPVAVSPDGVVESVEVPSRRFAIGTQWHPEAAASATAGPLLAEALVRAAASAA